MTPEREQRRNNRRTAWVLGSIALVFFVGIMLKYVVLK
ncbi:MAG TPA: cytochrome oxidase small assembly protein [Burkholderiales bacterium]|nr:cytochrome oxidase small assembly protein [Burkholderiales bacterium]